MGEIIVRPAEDLLRERITRDHPALCHRIASGEKLTDQDREIIVATAAEVAAGFKKKEA